MTRTKSSEEQHALTPEQAARIVEDWSTSFLNDDSTIGDFLVILRGLVYERQESERENLLTAIERQLMPLTTSACFALDGLIEQRRRRLQKS